MLSPGLRAQKLLLTCFLLRFLLRWLRDTLRTGVCRCRRARLSSSAAPAAVSQDLVAVEQALVAVAVSQAPVAVLAGPGVKTVKTMKPRVKTVAKKHENRENHRKEEESNIYSF